MGMFVRKLSTIDVVDAAKIRIRNIFSNGLKVYLSFSGGKDSICLAGIVYELAQAGEIDPAQMEVIFIDEEGMYEDVIEIVEIWRRRFMLIGAKFTWYCLQVRHYNCLHQLVDDESHVCWDQNEREKWIRQPPSYAVMSHPLLRERIDRYQEFLVKLQADGLVIDGVRMAESFQRRDYMARSAASVIESGGTRTLSKGNRFSPLYDFTDNDVWLFIRDRNLEFPEVYMKMWQIGVSKKLLRVSQFFAIDTVGHLYNLSQFYPELMARICRREPNAYIAILYYDSEMFHRNSRNRRRLEGNIDTSKDYKSLLIDLFTHIDQYFTNPHAKSVAEGYKSSFLSNYDRMEPQHYRRMYEGLKSGDTKMRTLRGICADIKIRYAKRSEIENAERIQQ